MPSSVTTHSRIDLCGPGLDATHQVVHRAEALALEKHRDLHAATAVVADHHHVAVRVDVVAAYRDQMHRDVLGSRQLAEIQFPGFAHIKQDRVGTVVVGQPFSELSCANLLHQKENWSLAPAPSSAGMTVSNRLTVL